MKSNEKRLLIMSLILFATIGGLILSKRFLSWQRALVTREQAVSLERTEADTLLKEAPLWRARGEWLVQHQPVAKSELDADNELFETLVKNALTDGVTIVNKQFLEPVKNEFYHQRGVTLTVKGDLASVFHWIYSVQSPTEFRVVPYLKITPDKDDLTKVDCSVKFWRWYQSSNLKTT
ncbi:MAG: hypothetical protein WCN98_13625 [Verrucomicrobiaceae bacterium]